MANQPVEALHEEGLDTTIQALDNVTSTAAEQHHDDPKSHLRKPADHQESHGWLSKYLPSRAYINNMEANYHLGNWVRDRKTNEKSWESMSIYVRLGMHLLYYGTYQERLLGNARVLSMLKAQSEKMGKQYDDPASKTHIQPFIDSFGLGNTLSDLVEPDPTKYANFNEFFARAIKPESRPIDEPDDEYVTSSPADSRLTAFPTIDTAAHFWVKGANFTMERLFQDANLAQQFQGGSMVIARLAPQDYHRWHAPVSGIVKSVREIPGAYYTVNPQAINEPGTINVFCENRRSVMVVERTPTKSPVAIVAVGAMLVGSIEYVGDAGREGAEIKRGQCLGKFLYGGSTVIVFYPMGEVELDEDLVKYSTDPNGACETLVRVGWRIGGR